MGDSSEVDDSVFEGIEEMAIKDVDGEGGEEEYEEGEEEDDDAEGEEEYEEGEEEEGEEEEGDVSVGAPGSGL